MSLHITGDDAADRLLTDDPLALLIGMLLDQQVAMETAFAGPLKIAERAGTLDADAIATFDPDAFAELFKATPAVHRFPGSMAARVGSAKSSNVTSSDDVSRTAYESLKWLRGSRASPADPGLMTSARPARSAIW